MKKTLLALALAGLSTAAVADVTLYGQIKAGIEVVNTNTKVNGVKTQDTTTTQIADFGSRIGFRGHENIAPNLNVIWQLEQKTSIAGNQSGWGTRESFIGLEGNWGKLRAGNLATQLDDMGVVDQWEYDSNALGLGIFTRTGEKVVSVRYDSPVFAGFSFNVQFTPRDNQADSGRASNLSDTSAYYAGLNYENAGFWAQYGLGYKHGKFIANSDSKSGQAHRLEFGYNANNLFVGLGYQYTNGWQTEGEYLDTLWGTTGAPGSAGVKTHEAVVSAAYTMGNVTPKFTYAHGFDAKTKKGKLEGTKYDQVLLGADYDFSKRTTAFAQAGWLRTGKGDTRSNQTGGLVGLRHKF